MKANDNTSGQLFETSSTQRLAGRIRPRKKITCALEALDGPDYFVADVYDFTTEGVGLVVGDFELKDTRFCLHLDGGQSVQLELRWATLCAEKNAYRCGFVVAGRDQPGIIELQRLVMEDFEK